MTATDELRRLLDERGVKWKSGDFINPNVETQWGNNCYTDYPELPPYLTISNCTPEQAIAATLGSDREAELEALAKDLYESAVDFNFKGWMPYYRDRFAALGIEVEQ